jgi:hypothetical protein
MSDKSFNVLRPKPRSRSGTLVLALHFERTIDLRLKSQGPGPYLI